jgi:3-oxoacyl-[acyl-carrier protein] reductase
MVGPHYTASKAALSGFARSLAPHGVTVNAVTLTLIEGGETLPGGAEPRAELARKVPVGSLGTPAEVAEVAEVVHALVTNPYLTAQTFSVDGGMHPR